MSVADLDYLYQSVQIAAVFIQLFTLLAVVLYVRDTRAMAIATRQSAEVSAKTLEEMKEARDQESAPYIMVYFDVPYGEWIIYLVVKNVGKGLAENIRLNFQPGLRTSDSEDRFEKLALIQRGIPNLPPGQEIRTLFDSSIAYMGSDLPRTYEVVVTYSGGISTAPRKSNQILDLAVFEGLMFTHEKTMHNLVEEVEDVGDEVEKLREEVTKIGSTLSGGLWFKNPDLLIANPMMGSDAWLNSLRAKLLELKLLWTSASEQDRSEWWVKELEDLKARCANTSSQLLSILAQIESDRLASLLDPVNTVIRKLAEFQRSDIFQYLGSQTQGLGEIAEFQTAIVDAADQAIAKIDQIIAAFSAYQ